MELLSPKVPVLFTLPHSIYDDLSQDTYNKERDALNYSGSCAIIAHPPCRAWSRLKGMAKPLPGERWLAVWAALKINKNGGVLEHPAGSALWKSIGLPLPGQPSKFNGFTISVDQRWFGHPCSKKTYLYINGCKLVDLPALPMNFDAVQFTIGKCAKFSKKYNQLGKKEIGREWRKKTPEAFARWLIIVAQIIERKKLLTLLN